MARLKQRKQAREINVNPEISILALVSFPGTSRRLGSHVARRLFDGSFWLDQTVLSVNNTMPRAGRPSSRAAFEATKFLLHFSSYNLMAGGRVEHGRRPLLKPVRVGLREQGCVAGAVCFTCNKGNAIKIANMGRHASDISQGSDGSSADSQTALRGRTDFFRLCYSGY